MRHPLERLRPLPLLALLTLSTPAHDAQGANPSSAEELFAANCASCHGPLGDGDGTAELDRRARSFRDGGFSYGNTEDAIVRTIANGIPGTPMPSFGGVFPEPVLRRLAAHVRSLGPPVREVTGEEATLVVTDRPLVVRGLLPPITGGAVAHPRGLLIGTTSGLTFEYRVDDVRLLGLRLGAFVEHTDWSGRGGTALHPLGQLVHAVDDGTPDAPFAWRATPDAVPVPLTATFEGTWTHGEAVGLRYALSHPSGASLADVRERVLPFGGAAGSGFARRFEVVASASDAGELRFASSRIAPESVVAELRTEGAAPVHWTVSRHATEGRTRFECTGISASTAVEGSPAARHEPSGVSLAWRAGAAATIDVVTLITTDWNDDVRQALASLPSVEEASRGAR